MDLPIPQTALQNFGEFQGIMASSKIIVDSFKNYPSPFNFTFDISLSYIYDFHQHFKYM